MPDAIIFFLPMPDNRANARYGHPMQEVRAKSAYFAQCALRCQLQRVPEPPAAKPDRARVEVEVRHRSRRYLQDRDNLYARVKWPLDFVKALWLVDDGPAHCDLVVTQAVKDGSEPALCSLRVTITPLEGSA